MPTVQPTLSHPGAVGFTLCFDWVIRATGSADTALLYGLVWRYAQMREKRCRASCSRMASDLGWSRQRVMRHLRRLHTNGLIACLNPEDLGTPRHYIPLSEDAWRRIHPASRACSESKPVTPQHTPCAESHQPPVAKPHTSITNSKTSKIREGARPSSRPRSPDPARDHSSLKRHPDTEPPAIQAFHKVTGWLPPEVLYQKVCQTLGPQPQIKRLRECYAAWCERGFNPRSLAWLFEWYKQRHIPPARKPGYRSSAATNDEWDAEEFSRWAEYQRRVIAGEDRDAVKSELGLT